MCILLVEELALVILDDQQVIYLKQNLRSFTTLQGYFLLLYVGKP